MPGGKRYKWQGSEVSILIGFDATTPNTISAITKANPAVVTVTAHGRADGDTVFITGVVGMDEINESAYVINVTGANAFELVGVDSTDYGTYTSGGTITLGDFANWCELTNYNRQGGTSPEIDATSICSTAAEYETGLPDFGTTQMDYRFAPRTAIQEAIQRMYQDGERTAVRIKLPLNGGERIQMGTIQQTSETAGNGGLWNGSMTIRNTGAPYDVPAV